MPVFQFIQNRYGSKKGFVRSLYYCFLQPLNKKFDVIPAGTSRVVFVCKGNICRSAAAESYFKSRNALKCCSLGLDTTSGKPANARICSIAKKYGVNLDSHLTTAVSDFVPMAGDFYICMEPAHIQQLHQKLGKVDVALLGLFGSPKMAYIHDPYNANDAFADSCTQYILAAVDQLSSSLNSAAIASNR
jgi:protein-tyrosine phosphatase